MATSAAGLCRRLGMELVRILPGREGASLAVLLVRTADGGECVLKQFSPGEYRGQVPTLQAATGSGTTPNFLGEIESGLYLAQWLPGRSLADIPLEESVDAKPIGRLIANFHRINPPAGLQTTGPPFFSRRASGWRNLSPELRLRGQQLTATLESADAWPQVLLHGDLAPANVMEAQEGWRLIDPLGLIGSPAWDLAQAAVTVAGRGRRNFLPGLLEGYGSDVPHLAETLAWMVLHYFDKNLAVQGSPFTAHLRPLAAIAGTTDTQPLLEGLGRS